MIIHALVVCSNLIVANFLGTLQKNHYSVLFICCQRVCCVKATNKYSSTIVLGNFDELLQKIKFRSKSVNQY